MELKRIAKLFGILCISAAILSAGIVGAFLGHEEGNVNYSGSYFENTYVAMGLGVDEVVNATDAILLGWAYGTDNVTHTWGVGWGLYNPDCDFDNDGYVGSHDASILCYYYSGPPITAEIDIQPTTLNLKSNGANISAYITFPDYSFLDNLDIHLWSVRIDGVYATGFIGWHKVSFNRTQVREYLTSEPDYESAPKFYDLTLTVVGQVSGAPFQGSNVVTVIKG